MLGPLGQLRPSKDQLVGECEIITIATDAGPEARGALRPIVVRVSRAPALRLAALTAALTALAVHAAAIYPILRELDTAATARAAYDAHGAVELRLSEVPQAQQELSPATAAFAHWLVGDAQAGGHAATLAVLITATPELSSLMLTPDETLLEDSTTPDGPWIDINARTSVALRVGAGDSIELAVAPERNLTLEVRRIYGVGETYGGQIAVAPAEAIVPHLEGEDSDLQSVVYVDGLEEGELGERLSEEFFSSRLEQGGYDIDAGVPVSSREADARAMEDSSLASFAVILAIALAAIVGGGALVLREVTWFARVCATPMSALVVLGASPRGAARLTAAVGIVAAAGGATIGWLLGLGLLGLHIFVPAVPPVLTPLWVLCWAVTVVAASGMVVLRVRAWERGQSS